MEIRLLLLAVTALHVVSAVTDSEDAAVMESLKNTWRNFPPSWLKSDDPCGSSWEGVTCNNSRITSLSLSTMGLKGTLSGDIGGLTELHSLDLSFNLDLMGSLSPTIGNLKNLNILLLAGCSFTGKIPEELGNLSQLSFLALNSNNFTGEIPPSLGKLSKLYWLDLGDNQLTGPLPVSPGLDQLLNAKHFHLSKNRLSGAIPAKLFSSRMILIHVLFDGNQFTGRIPPTLGLVLTLEILRLDRNSLSGPVPANLKDLTRINELHLANNQLTGPIPNLNGMDSLNYVDLSNNNFDPSEAPTWFSTAKLLTTLVIESGRLQGPIPQTLFSFQQLQEVKLRNNKFNGTLNMGDGISPRLKLVDLQFNNISSITLGAGYIANLQLHGNPICSQVSNPRYCQLEFQQDKPYSTSLAACGTKSCPEDQKLDPQSCGCAYPYEGTLYFRAPYFRDLSNSTTFHSLEMGLWTALDLTPGSVSLQNLFFNSDDYLQVQVELFPSTGKYFTRSEIQRIGFDLTNHTFRSPREFGPYYFIGSPYTFSVGSRGKPLSLAVIIIAAVGSFSLVVLLVGVGIYALRQKKRAEIAIGQSNPFASWGSNIRDSGRAPQLKGARWFSYDELKKSTNNFSDKNEIGCGAYGKVYKGMLPGVQMVAIKRGQQASMQGGLEFKTEIELLSRVHHKNLVSLVGFCFEQGEQMLIYEYIPNGTLRESLSGKSGIYLDWKRRVQIALGSARGLAYLHELANPPIIHRDVKTTNILLDETLTPKVADFGLSKLALNNLKDHVSTQVKGTLGYLDPEYYMTNCLTTKSDVYSFGVVMLELLTARQPLEKGKYIVREVQMRMDKNDHEHYYGMKELLDPTIKKETNLIGLGKFVELALKCAEDLAAERPTMSEVVMEIESILKNEGVNTSATSASSSATDFESAKGSGASRHPYNETLPRRDDTSSSWTSDYSSGHTLSNKVDP